MNNKYYDIVLRVNNAIFWQDSDCDQVLKQKTSLESKLNRYRSFIEKFNYLNELILLKDNSLFNEILTELTLLENQIKPMYLDAMFKLPQDKLSAFIEINAGTGGDDSQDLAVDLERMYLKYAKNMGFESEIINRLADGVGIKQSIIQINGENVYGLLKRETGIHRFVRISPFNSQGKRQTSFVSVFVTPVVDDKVEIKINPADLRVDTYRSSGAGGQHVNKTESAIRITHIPSGIVVTCQDGRSQHQNRDRAMKILLSKLYKKDEDEKKLKQNSVIKDDISWGNQVRNYVFAPYKLVKDLRSSYETTQIDKIMNGELDDLILTLIKGGF